MNVEAQIEKLQPSEGDVLVVRLAEPMTQHAYAELRDAIRRTEVGVPVVVLDEGEVTLADRARLAEELGLEEAAIRARLRLALPSEAPSELADAVLGALRHAGVPLPRPKSGGDG